MNCKRAKVWVVVGVAFSTLVPILFYIGCAKQPPPPQKQPSHQTLSPPIPAPSLERKIGASKPKKAPGAVKETQIDLSAIDHILQELTVGSIAFNTPKTMLLERTHPLYLLLSPTKSIQELEQELQQTIPGDQSLQSASIKIAPEMEARLTGQDFEIKAVTPEILAVSGKDETRWQWDVTPAQEGTHTLHLTLSAILSINNHSTLRAVQTFDKTITIEVTVRQRLTGFVSHNWQWLWGVIGIPSFAWMWTKKRKKRGPTGFHP